MSMPMSVMDAEGLSSTNSKPSGLSHFPNTTGESLLVIPLTNAPQIANHPPANIPYTTPNTSTPATTWPVMPHRTNVATDVQVNMKRAMIQGET